MDDLIDYEVIANRLIIENEALRQRLNRPPIDVGQALAKARDFVEDNYLVIMALLLVASSLVSGLYTLYQDRRRSV